MVDVSDAISALGALHVVVLTGARIPYAMARDGVFFPFAKRIHPSFRTPSGALIFLGAVATLLALSGLTKSSIVICLWRVDFLRVNRDCPASLHKKSQLVPAVPRLGLSLDAAHLLAAAVAPYCELVDGPACALFTGPGGDPGRRSVLLPLAQAGPRLYLGDCARVMPKAELLALSPGSGTPV